MKNFYILMAFLTGLVFCGCSIAERDMNEVGTQFQEGIQGRGRIVDNNPTQDSFGPDFR